jgi:signal transduction histidine kinase
MLAAGQVRALVNFSSTEPDAFSADVVPTLVALVRETAGTFNTLMLLDREREATIRLQELDAVKNEFVGTVAHDLRSPMTIIANFAQLLRERDDTLTPEDRAHLLERIVANIHRLSHLVGDVLDVARIDSGEFHYATASFDLAGVVREAMDEVAALEPSRSCELDLGDALPPAFGDPNRYRRVLDNLLTNALKFSPEHEPVSVSVTGRDEELEVRVCDRGVGVDPADVPRLFQRFSRIEQAGQAIPGTGLGLYISRQLVEDQHGRIWVESAPGEGSTFVFTVPTARGRT